MTYETADGILGLPPEARRGQKTLGVRAGIDNPNPRLAHLNPHIFRHSIASWLKSRGFSAEWIQNFLGHQSYKTTMDMYGLRQGFDP